MFDTYIVTNDDFWWALLSFSAVFIGLQVLWRVQPIALRVPRTKNIYYGGAWLALVAAVAVALTVNNIRLAAGLIIATGVLLRVARADEKKSLPPWQQLIAQVAIALMVTLSGWAIPHISNPFGTDVLTLSQPIITSLFTLGSLITLIWLVLLMNTVNWLDGSDGLAASVSLVALATLAAVSLLPQTQDHLTLQLSLLGIGVVAAFLVWNWYPARFHLGTTGSWFLGLYIGLVAIVGGGKIATTLLVFAIPVLDVAAVIVSRLRRGQAPWQGDRVHHLHFRLRARSLNPSHIALLLTGITVLLGIAALVLQTYQKIVAFSSAAIIFSAALALFLSPLRPRVK